MRRIPFDIKYRSEIESGKYKVETEDGRSAEILKWDAKVRKEEGGFLIVCVDCGESILYIYDSKGKIHEKLVKGTHLDLVIYTDEPEEHPIIKELKEHLASLSENDRQKELKELQEWYEERFKPEQKDWVEEFRKCLEAMSPEEFEEKWNEVKKRCGEDTAEDNLEELTEFEYAVLSVISDHNSHTDSIEEFAKRNAKKLLTLAYKQFEKERIDLPEDKLESIDFFFDHWRMDNVNASERECFRTGYACGRASIKSEIPKWKKNKNCVCGGDRDIFLIRTAPGYYFTSAVLSPNCEYIELHELENLPEQ